MLSHTPTCTCLRVAATLRHSFQYCESASLLLFPCSVSTPHPTLTLHTVNVAECDEQCPPPVFCTTGVHVSLDGTVHMAASLPSIIHSPPPELSETERCHSERRRTAAIALQLQQTYGFRRSGMPPAYVTGLCKAFITLGAPADGTTTRDVRLLLLYSNSRRPPSVAVPSTPFRVP